MLKGILEIIILDKKEAIMEDMVRNDKIIVKIRGKKVKLKKGFIPIPIYKNFKLPNLILLLPFYLCILYLCYFHQSTLYDRN